MNSDRGNLDFDNGGTENAEAPGNYSDSDSWEPRDAVKGDVARMIFYMSVRWDGGDGHPDLEVNDQVNNDTAPHIGRLSTLLVWNAEDPPDAFEERRNEEIYALWQHNRTRSSTTLNGPTRSGTEAASLNPMAWPCAALRRRPVPSST